jgi:hypothetical protein
MSPLIKLMLREKSRIPHNSVRLRTINERISEVIYLRIVEIDQGKWDAGVGGNMWMAAHRRISTISLVFNNAITLSFLG